MAPNRKQLACITDVISGLDIVQPKFLPLTHPQEEQQQQQQKASVVIESSPAANEAVASYWDWPSNESSEDGAKVESKDLFSMDFIEANLIRESEVLKEKLASQKTIGSTNSNDYWAERVEDDLNDESDGADIPCAPLKPAEVSYWEWPSDPRQVQINLILADEFARQQVSSETVEKRLTESVKPVASASKASNDSYWTWDVSKHGESKPSTNYWTWETVSETEAKDSIIQAILEHESIRQQLCVERIERDLVKESSLPPKPCKSESDDYWQMTNDDTQNYWDWSPVSSDSYWVM